MIKAIIFDMGSVLISDDWEMIYKRIAKKIKVSQKKVKDISKPLLKEWSIGKINEGEFWKKFEIKLGRKINQGFTKDLWLQEHMNYVKNINKSWKIVTELKTQKIRLAILSNIITPHISSLQKTGRIAKLKKLGFKYFIWSCKVGVRKPNLKIYRIVLKRLNLSAKNCIFIDDKLVNIKAAEKLGIIGIHFQTPNKLKKDLIKFGVL